MSIEANIQLRNKVKEIAELARSEAADSEQSETYWELLAEMLEDVLTRKVVFSEASEPPMTDEEARRFGKTMWMFGIHQGKLVDDLPLSYLEWFADSPVWKQVKRYLQSNRIKSE